MEVARYRRVMYNAWAGDKKILSKEVLRNGRVHDRKKMPHLHTNLIQTEPQAKVRVREVRGTNRKPLVN